MRMGSLLTMRFSRHCAKLYVQTCKIENPLRPAFYYVPCAQILRLPLRAINWIERHFWNFA